MSRRELTLVALTLAAIALCMLFVDRPLALLCLHTFGPDRLRYGLDHLFWPLAGITVIALTLYTGVRNMLLAIATALAAALANDLLKLVFGRSRPDPVFLYFHQYGFHLVHPSLWWSSFPSATLAFTVALATFLGRTHPRLRSIVLVLTLTIAAVIVASNAHWLSDVLGGALLGTLVARAALRRFHQALPPIRSA